MRSVSLYRSRTANEAFVELGNVPSTVDVSIVISHGSLNLGWSELLLHSKPKLPGECHSLFATRPVDVPPRSPLTLSQFKLVSKQGGVKVRFATPFQGSLMTWN